MSEEAVVCSALMLKLLCKPERPCRGFSSSFCKFNKYTSKTVLCKTVCKRQTKTIVQEGYNNCPKNCRFIFTTGSNLFSNWWLPSQERPIYISVSVNKKSYYGILSFASIRFCFVDKEMNTDMVFRRTFRRLLMGSIIRTIRKNWMSCFQASPIKWLGSYLKDRVLAQTDLFLHQYFSCYLSLPFFSTWKLVLIYVHTADVFSTNLRISKEINIFK